MRAMPFDDKTAICGTTPIFHVFPLSVRVRRFLLTCRCIVDSSVVARTSLSAWTGPGASVRRARLPRSSRAHTGRRKRHFRLRMPRRTSSRAGCAVCTSKLRKAGSLFVRKRRFAPAGTALFLSPAL